MECLRGTIAHQTFALGAVQHGTHTWMQYGGAAAGASGAYEAACMFDIEFILRSCITYCRLDVLNIRQNCALYCILQIVLCSEQTGMKLLTVTSSI